MNRTIDANLPDLHTSPADAPGRDRVLDAKSEEPSSVAPKRMRRWLRVFACLALFLIVVGVVVRAFLPSVIIYYVNKTLDENPLYDGKVDDVDLHLYRGAYTIKDVKLIKTTGNVPVPLFSAPEIDLAISWDGIRHGKLVGSVRMNSPEVNFVDSKKAGSDKNGEDQTGAGGPWLAMLNDLFPFKINRVLINNGSVHFRAYPIGEKPVDVYLSRLEANVDNLTNIRDETAPMITTVTATGLAMDTARFEYQMKLDPFSYKPTFHMMMRLLNLDVTRLNDLTRTYGAFDFEHGWFDLVIELDAKEGYLKGYTKPLFRQLKIFTAKDLKEDNVLEAFWEALVGGAQELLKNHNRDQFGTLIPFTGQVDGPKANIFDTIINVLRNGFIRAYLPKLQNDRRVIHDDSLQFQPPTLSDPVSFGDDT